MLCMAMMFAFTCQFAFAVVDHVAHATDTPHAASDLGGAVVIKASSDQQAPSEDGSAADNGFVDHAHLDEGHSNAMPISRLSICAPISRSCSRIVTPGWVLSEMVGSPDRRPPRA